MRKDEIKRFNTDKSILLGKRQIADIEMICAGFFPCGKRFMSKSEVLSVWNEFHLSDGEIWTYPVVLPVDRKIADTLAIGDYVALTDKERAVIAFLELEEIWEDDFSGGLLCPEYENREQIVFLSGVFQPNELPVYYDFPKNRFNIEGVRKLISDFKIERDTSLPLCVFTNGLLFEFEKEYLYEGVKKDIVFQVISDSVPEYKIDFFTRIKACVSVTEIFGNSSSHVLILPYIDLSADLIRQIIAYCVMAKRIGFKRVLLSYSICSSTKNISESILNRTDKLLKDMGMSCIIPRLCFTDSIRTKNLDRIGLIAGEGMKENDIVKLLREGEYKELTLIPDKVVKILKNKIKPKNKAGVTLFFTGLSGSGKSTLAKAVNSRLQVLTEREITLLDGDVVRRHLSSELGFSKEHRNLNIRRIGFVASEITKNCGIAICAPIAPYDAIRKEVRHMVERYGVFILVYMSTPLEVCEKRDRKGLYAKARAGVIKEFTGVSDPYEAPDDAEIVIDSSSVSIEDAAERVLNYLQKEIGLF